MNWDVTILGGRPSPKGSFRRVTSVAYASPGFPIILCFRGRSCGSLRWGVVPALRKGAWAVGMPAMWGIWGSRVGVTCFRDAFRGGSLHLLTRGACPFPMSLPSPSPRGVAWPLSRSHLTHSAPSLGVGIIGSLTIEYSDIFTLRFAFLGCHRGP